MTFLNFILLSFLYFWCSSTALSLGIGYYTLYRPIISGMITGLILGDFILGMLAGSIVNIIYIDFISTGGSLKGDQCLTAIMAAIAAIIFKLSPIEASAIAYPFGYAGILIWKYRLSINSVFVRKYDEKYSLGLNPNITIYDGVLPQILLYAMSTIIILISVGAMLILKTIIINDSIKHILFLFGIFMINNSIFNVLYKIKNKFSKIIYFAILIFVFVFNVSSIIMMFVLLIFLLGLTYKDILSSRMSKSNKHESKVLNKRDLVFSWFIWMNFSHACYNYERLQGMAYAHSMKNVIKKLYKDDEMIMSTINKYTEFFNTEPNIGTPIHGYIISLEEEKSLGNEIIDISYIKKGMMGIAAGLGDSFTQVVLSPLFMSMSIMLSLDNKYFEAMIPVILLSGIIIYLSYSGWMNGYYLGRESLIKRISSVKRSKIKLYFPLIFAGILGAVTGKLIKLNYSIICNDLFNIIVITIISIIFMVVKLKTKDKY